MMISQEGCFHLTPLISCSSALFCATECPQLLFHQLLPHSFPCNGGWRVSLAHPLAARHSPRATVSPVFATHPRDRQLTPLFATHPKMGLRKSLVCHTYDTLPRVCIPLSSQIRGPVRQPNRKQGGCLSSAPSYELRVTHRSHCMRGGAVPQLA